MKRTTWSYEQDCKSFLLHIYPFQDFAQISDSFIQSTCISRTPTTGQAPRRDWGTNAEQVWPGAMEETADQPQMQEGLLLLVTTSCWPLFTPSFKETMQGILREQEEEKGEATTGLQIIFPRVWWYNLRQFLSLLKALKTDNAPAYISKSFQEFCLQFQIKHNTGIPYNPQGQAIVKRAHQTLKIQIQKLKRRGI